MLYFFNKGKNTSRKTNKKKKNPKFSMFWVKKWTKFVVEIQ